MNKGNFKRVTVTFCMIVAVLSVALFAYDCNSVEKYLPNDMQGDTIQAQNEEAVRAKAFVNEWYVQLSATYNDLDDYLNELRFHGGAYTLTSSQNRLRAVYPAETKTFEGEYLKNVEFFTVSGKLRCRIYYGKDSTLYFIMGQR